MKSRAFNIALLGISMSLITIVTLIPIAIGTVELAYALIPVLVVAIICNVKLGALIGGFWGLMSMIAALTTSASPLRFVFYNPLVSVVPRIIVGVVAPLIYNALIKTKLGMSPKGKGLAVYISALTGVICNSVLVLGAMLLFYNGKDFEGIVINFKFIAAIILALNTLLEIIIIPLLVTPIVVAVQKSLKQTV